MRVMTSKLTSKIPQPMRWLLRFACSSSGAKVNLLKLHPPTFFFFWNTHPPTFYNRSSTGSTRINKLKWNKRYQKSKLLLEVLLYFIYFNPWFHSISFGPYNRYIILKHINMNCYSYPVSLKYASHTITNAFKWDNYGKRKLRQNQFKDKDK